MNRPILFHAPGAETMATDIAVFDGNVDRGSIRWKRFADGSSDHFIENVGRDVKNRDVVFLANFENEDHVFRQMSVICAFHPYGAASLTVLIPYFTGASSDRIIVKGDIVMAKTLVRALDMTDQPARVVVLDPHDEHLFHYFRQCVPEFVSMMPSLMAGLTTPRSTDGNMPRMVCFPDDGARKRYGQYAPDAIVCAKVRNGTERKVTIIEGDPKGAHVTIVDDMIQRGGTAAECAKALHAAGAASVAIRAVHGVLPDPSASILGTARAREIVVTDSLPTKSRTARFLPGSDVRSCAPALARAMR